ncbi:MAG: DUF547 domain-containing protein [Aureispira sp.]
MSSTPNELAQQLLLAVKMQQDSQPLQDQLAQLTLDQLEGDLSLAKRQKAFWINCYNAYFLILRRDQQVDKSDIYTKAFFTIAQQKFSLDDVEHGILRRFRYKYSLGYWPQLFVPAHIRRLAVEAVDYRIHFALNCGAKSCPPIAFYTPKDLSKQLNAATQSFLEQETDFDDERKIVHTTRLFLWYLGDFGSPWGIRQIFKAQLNKDIRGYKIKYKRYSWDEDLDNFVS